MKISIQEVKNALKDSKFRKSLPEGLKTDILKYEQNPGCPCNWKIYRNVLKFASKQLKAYYPNAEEVEDIEKQEMLLLQNHWLVINCHVDELENKLKELPPGRKMIQIARWENQITVVINDLDFVY